MGLAHVQTRAHCLAGSLGRPRLSVRCLDPQVSLQCPHWTLALVWCPGASTGKGPRARLLSAASRANDSRAVRATVTERPDTLDTALTTQATEVSLLPAKVALVSSSREAHGIEGCVLSVCLSHESGSSGSRDNFLFTSPQSGSLSTLMSERRVSRVPVLLWSPPL